MSPSKILCLLADRAARSLPFYDGASASIVVYALGVLRLRPPHTPQLLRCLSPSLPTYTARQLTVLMEGLSLLRVSHNVMTAHVLQLFLRRLRDQRRKAFRECATIGDVAVVAAALQEEVAAMAGMIRVLQQHHTQRTVRAFLAAAERALRAEDTLRNVPDAKFGLQRTEKPVWTESAERSRFSRGVSGASATSFAAFHRQAAVQLLYLFEVYVSAGVDVAVPHTPQWLRRMLLVQVPPALLTLQELLHVHTRCFPLSQRHVLGGTKSLDESSRSLLLSQAVNVVVAVCAAVTGDQKRETFLCTAAMPPRPVSAQEQVKWLSLMRQLSETERHIVLRCALLIKVNEGDEVIKTALMPYPFITACLCDNAFAASWHVFVSAVIFHRLTREVCNAMCNSPQLSRWWWWADLLRASTAFYQLDDSSGNADLNDVTLQSVALLQLLYAHYTLAGLPASSSLISRGIATPSAPSAASSVIGHPAHVSDVVAIVQQLCVTLSRFLTIVNGKGGLFSATSETWELLSLLLFSVVEGNAVADTKATRLTFTLWLRQQMEDDSLKSDADRGSKTQMLLFDFCVTKEATAMLLLRKWYLHWMNSQFDFTSVSSGAEIRHLLACSASTTPFDALRTHWSIAACVDRLLYYQADNRAVNFHSATSSLSCTVNERLCRTAFMQLMSVTSACFNTNEISGAADWSERESGLAFCDATTRAPLEGLLSDVLCVIASGICGTLDQEGTSQKPSLLQVLVCQSTLLDAVCAGLERLWASEDACQSSSTCYTAFGTLGKSFMESTKPVVWLRLCQRGWWVFAAQEGRSSFSEAANAVQSLLFHLFSPKFESASHAFADIQKRIGSFFFSSSASLRWWIFRLLILHLDHHIAVLSQSEWLQPSRLLPPHCLYGDTSTVVTPQASESCADSLLSFQTINGITMSQNSSSSSNHDTFSLLRFPSFFVPPSFQTCASFPLTHPTDYAQVADTMMSNIESLWNWGTHAFTQDTLRDVSVRHVWRTTRAANTSDLTTTRWAHEQLWYRDARRIKLTPRERRGSRDSNGGDAPLSNVAGAAGASLRGNHEAHSSTDAETLARKDALRDLLEHVYLITSAASFLCRCNVDQGLHTLHRSNLTCGPKQKDSNSSSSASQKLDASCVRTQLPRLRTLFWDYCHDALAICDAAGLNRVDTEQGSQQWTIYAESAVLQGALLFGEVKEYSRDELPSGLPEDINLFFRPCRGSQLRASSATETSVLSLVLPRLWETLHDHCTVQCPQREGMLARVGSDHFRRTSSLDSSDGGAPPGVLDVWRLRVFAGAWCRRLPLSEWRMAAHERLLTCLRVHVLGDGGRCEATTGALQEAVDGLARSIHQNQWTDASNAANMQRPFRFQSEMLDLLSRSTRKQRSRKGTELTRYLRELDELSPIEVYVHHLLPRHPFCSETGDGAMKSQDVPSVRLVVLTWLHVLVIHGLCAHHPRLILENSRGGHDGSVHSNSHQMSCVEHVQSSVRQISLIEKNLLGDVVRTQKTENCTVADESRSLLQLCLVRELKAAVGELDVIVADLSQAP